MQNVSLARIVRSFGFHGWVACLGLAAMPGGAAMAAIPIDYQLASPGQISLAIYDDAGRMVRTLLNAESQTAGKHSATWDGLDQQGRPAPPGRYTWKLLQGEGIKAEYLMSIGTSVGIHHWVGQHGGPNAVLVEDDAIIVGGSPEGSPLMCKIKFDGTYEWPTASVEPSGGLTDITIDQGKLYAVLPSGNLFTFDAKTGVRASGPKGLSYIAKKLGPIAYTEADEKSLDVPLPRGRYMLRVTVGDATQNTAPIKVLVEGHEHELTGANAGKYATDIAPQLYRWPRPVDSQDENLGIKLVSAGGAWAVKEIEVLSVPAQIAARDGAFVAAFDAGVVAWLNPENNQILDVVPLPDVRDLALVSADEAVAISGNRLVRIDRQSKAVTELCSGLVSPRCLAIDPKSQDIFVAEGGDRHQLQRFDNHGKLQATFGREGGRQAGLYRADDFLDVSAIAADGHGGFVITEDLSAPRRTARFNADGKLLQEWYGGQQFYTFAAPDPQNPNLVWMDSQWGWLMQAEVDYTKRTWKVRACYPWAAGFDNGLLSGNKMASRIYPMHADLDADGKQETYLWSQSHNGLLLKVDEAAGKLQPIAALGNVRWNPDPTTWPKPWAAALEYAGKTKEAKFHTAFSWADANGDFQMQPAEFRLAERGGHGFQGGPNCHWLDEQFRLYTGNPHPDQPAYEIRSASDKTSTGAPLWDWDHKTITGPVLPFRGARAFRPDPDGNLIELVSGGGDGYADGLDAFHSHGAGWPGTMADRPAIIKFNPQGEVLWQVGTHAGRGDAPNGQVHYPVNIAGFVKGCIGVSDYFMAPCYFWSDDGLYLGELLDGRTDDGLPDRVYAWWRADHNQGDEFESNLALFQYDMLVGGSLFELPTGEVLFMGAGWNNVPVFRVHGLENLKRQTGTVEITQPATAAAGKGTGLSAEYFANLKWQSPVKSAEADLDDLLDQTPIENDETKPEDFAEYRQRRDDRLWYGDKRAWPEPNIVSRPFTARWKGTIEPRFSEPHTFALYVNGLARISIDGQPILETKGKNVKAFSKPLAMEAGRRYPVIIEYAREGSDKPELHLNWESPTQSLEHIPTSALYPSETTPK